MKDNKKLFIILLALATISILVGFSVSLHAQQSCSTDATITTINFDTSCLATSYPDTLQQLPSNSTDCESTEPETEPIDVESTPVPECTESETSIDTGSEPEAKFDPYIQLTDDEIYELATLVWLEGYAESPDCQRAIVSVVINRMRLWNMSLKDVIYASGQFTPAWMIEFTAPDLAQIGYVLDVIEYGPNIPKYVCYFRSKHFHSWHGMHDFEQMGKTYFSYSSQDYELYLRNSTR